MFPFQLLMSILFIFFLLLSSVWLSNLKAVTITNSKKGYKIGTFPNLKHFLKGV